MGFWVPYLWLFDEWTNSIVGPSATKMDGCSFKIMRVIWVYLPPNSMVYDSLYDKLLFGDIPHFQTHPCLGICSPISLLQLQFLGNEFHLWVYIYVYTVYVYIYIITIYVYIYIIPYIYIHYICKIIKHTGVREMRLNLQDLGLVEFVFSPKAYETSSLIIMLPCRSIPLPLTGSCVDLSPKWLGDLAAKKVKKTGQCLGRDTPEHGNCHEK